MDKEEKIVLSVMIVFLIFVGLVVWKSACVKAGIYNKINNTTYTCSDFFWAHDQINSNTQTIKLK